MSLITIDRKIFSQKKRFSQVIMNKKRFSQIKISTRKYIFHGGREGGGAGGLRSVHFSSIVNEFISRLFQVCLFFKERF